MAQKRIMKELIHLCANPSLDYSIELVDDTDLFLLRAVITGPKDSPYEGGIFPLSIHLPPNYPFSAPKVGYMVKVHHPSINCNGTVCNYMLSNHWSPSCTLEFLLLELRKDLEDVQTEGPMVPEIAHVYRTNYSLFWNTELSSLSSLASPRIDTLLSLPHLCHTLERDKISDCLACPPQ